MTYDPMEWTIRDPLEETVPDPLERRRGRVGHDTRRAIEVAAVILLIPGFLTVQWIDMEHQSRGFQTKEHVTVVPRGGTATLGRVRLRLLGRDATGSSKSGSAANGSALLKLVVDAQPLDAQGVKQLPAIAYTVRDRAGHVWSAGGETDPDLKPAVGTVSQVSVTATVPAGLVSSVVLEARPGGLLTRKPSGPTQVLRFAH
ncbi:hypothetical protein [Actinoallomurus iriomotensis]|uniref:Uncharacterized protein n=1 Tax=Actinoallomurus iriomotensis TaxID=478107 RepID=A0A9W6RFC2_9ACTN|nr:hypothetical protein [Actinoallomurus iriomotensis]GLY74758.1 hypothetical protein Airi01_030250 [Actinoallomurus iriomotensis]